MLKELNIKGYRRFQNVTFSNFKNINILTGPNNVGKSSVLKAVYAWSCGFQLSPMLFTSIAKPQDFHANSPMAALDAITSAFKNQISLPLKMSFAGIDEIPSNSRTFLHNVTPADLSVSNSAKTLLQKTTVCSWYCNDDLGNEHKFEISIPLTLAHLSPYREAQFINSLSAENSKFNSSSLDNLKQEGLLEEFTESIKREFDNIKSLDIINYGQKARSVSVSLNNGTRQPLSTLGEGLLRYFSILSTVMTGSNDILCVEQPELSLSKSDQENLCFSLLKYSVKNDKQIFLTTHSQEFIDNLLGAAYKLKKENNIANTPSLENISIYTLSEYNSRFRYRYLSGKDAYHARAELYLDLRGYDN